MTRRLVLPAIAVMTALTACGQQNSYEGARAALRDWLTAAKQGDEDACDLITTEYRQVLAAEVGTNGRPQTCEDLVAELADSRRTALPPADSAMQVPVWDPSGEASVEVSDTAIDRVTTFWLEFEDGRWLVAGDEASTPR